MRGRAGRGKKQQNYRSDQVDQSRKQQQQEYKMLAVKVEAEGPDRAEKQQWDVGVFGRR